MSDYTWPSIVIPTSTDLRFLANTGAFVSPLAGSVQTLGRGGDRWAMSVVCNNLTAEKRAVLQGFLARLRGQVHRVLIRDYSYRKRGTLASNLLVKGGAQTGSAVTCDGAAVGATLKIGDQIAIGYALHMVVADAVFDGTGSATLAIAPPLRTAPADNAAVAVLQPTSRFVMADNKVGWSNQGGGIIGAVSSFTVELIEDIAT